MGAGFGYGDSQSKLEVAKQSILALLKRLNEKDSFSLILFDDVSGEEFMTNYQESRSSSTSYFFQGFGFESTTGESASNANTRRNKP